MSIDDLIRPRAFVRDIHRSYFVAIGRALHVAQHFEKECRAVADLLDIKRAVYSGEVSSREPELPDFVERLRKRMLGGAIKHLANLPGFPDDVNGLLERAKDARNHVAHDCTLSPFHPLAEEEELWVSLESLLSDIRVIAEAGALVEGMLYMMNEHEPLMIPRDYVDTIVQWVFEDFQNEDFMQAN